jgi:hypothetical protein
LVIKPLPRQGGGFFYAKKMKYIYILLLILAATIDVDGSIIQSAFPLWLIPVLGSVAQGVAGQVSGNPRNVRKNRRRDLKDTTEQANTLYNTQMGNVSGSMEGYDEALGDLGDQYGDLKNLDKSFMNGLTKSYMDTTEGSAIMERIRGNTRKSKDKLRNDSSLMGLSEESYISGLGKVNEAEGTATGNLASNANANRANLRGSIMNLKNMMGANASTRGGMNLNKANFKSNLFSNSFNGAAGIMNQSDARMQNSQDQFSNGMGSASNMIMQALMASGGAA